MNVEKEFKVLRDAFNKTWNKEESMVESVAGKEVNWKMLKDRNFLNQSSDQWDRLEQPTMWLNVDLLREYFAHISRQTEQPILFLVTARPISSQSLFENVYELQKSFNDQLGVMDFAVLRAPWIALAVHLNNSHYILLLIHSKTKTIYSMDSLNKFTQHHSFMKIWQVYTRSNDWKVQPFNVPQQKNGYACGVYVCMCAWLLSQGILPDWLTFDQEFEDSHLEFRKKIALDLLG
jgi:hypothetical protein